MGEFKVGEKVKVRKDLIVGNRYGGYLFVKNMKQFIGKTVTIRRCSDNDEKAYLIDEDKSKGCYYWTEEMLEEYKEKSKNEVKLLDQDIANNIRLKKVIYNGNATILFYDTPYYDALGNVTKFGKERKVIAKCQEGDEFDKKKGLEVAILKAFIKESLRLLKKY